MLGAVEAGGTKVNVAVGPSPTDIHATARIPTTNPGETIAAMLDFFAPHARDLTAIGVGSFGPVRLDRSAPDWSMLLATPKPGWSGASFARPLIERFGVPVALDTDVNAAALAEHGLGALRGVGTGVYITVGTGIGAGMIVNGAPLHGLLHPEAGHVRMLRDLPDEDDFPGVCPHHGDCLEGLASGPAIARRWGAPLGDLPPGHPAHGLIADYLGQACAILALTLSAERIVIGGGVGHAPGLRPAIAARMRHRLAGYPPTPALAADAYIAAPALGDTAGLIGAMLLAECATARS